MNHMNDMIRKSDDAVSMSLLLRYAFASHVMVTCCSYPENEMVHGVKMAYSALLDRRPFSILHPCQRHVQLFSQYRFLDAVKV